MKTVPKAVNRNKLSGLVMVSYPRTNGYNANQDTRANFFQEITLDKKAMQILKDHLPVLEEYCANLHPLDKANILCIPPKRLVLLRSVRQGSQFPKVKKYQKLTSKRSKISRR
jgi:hypothetical protein